MLVVCGDRGSTAWRVTVGAVCQRDVYAAGGRGHD